MPNRVGLWAAALCCVAAGVASAADAAVRESLWNGRKRLDFQVDGRACLLVLPATPAPGKPWIWRTEFFGHEPQADLELIARGFHAAYIDVQNMYGAPVAMAHMEKFHAHLTQQYGLSSKPVLEGFSRGGLFALNWAARHPDQTSLVYGDAPVCDFRSWPGGKGKGKGSHRDWERCKQVYGLNEEQALAYRFNPVDNLEPLAKAKIPLLLVCGAIDSVVPLAENSGLVAKRYQALGGAATLICKPFCEHHPHSLRNPAPIVDFVLRHTTTTPLSPRGRGVGGEGAEPVAAPKTPYGYDYYVVRGGLDRCRAKFAQGGACRVAFLGGSITWGGKWRELVCDELQRRFPNAKFDFINAGISSLGSTPGAFRFARDVFARGPVDLLFAEAAVNDETNGQTPVEALRGMEGIVRQALLASPQMDVVCLHFVDPDKMEVIRKGRRPAVIESHEKVAVQYNVPSIDLAQEVTERIHAGEFTWEKDFRNLHPSPFGHGIYFQSIRRLFDAAWRSHAPVDVKPPTRELPRPLDAHSYFGGRLVDVSQAVVERGWELVAHWKPSDKAGTRAGFVDVPALVAQTPGAKLRFKFSGIGVGLFVAAGPDAGTVRWSVDGKPSGTRNLFTEWSGHLHLPWTQVLAADLAPGPHELTLEVAPQADPKSKGHAVRILHFLVNSPSAP